MSDVVILFGGASSERMVSAASAQNVATHLPGAALWFWSKSGELFVVDRAALAVHTQAFEREFAPSGKPTFPSLAAALDSSEAKGRTFFLALHGGDGENGVTQRLFEERGLAFTGSGSEASAHAFDKAQARKLAAAQGANVAEARQLPLMNVEQAKAALASMLEKHPRWVLKPQADGSSHGLIHLRKDQLDASAEALAGFKLPYLAEVFVEGRELTVGVVDDEGGPTALPVSEVRLIPGGAFDYAGKYLGKGTEEITPAQLSPEEWKSAQALAVLTHRAMGCSGYSRTDMILRSTGGIVLLEINTLPGMTKASFIPQQLAAAGRDVKDFLARQLELARARARVK